MQKRIKIHFLATIILFAIGMQNSKAQEISGGVVIYETYTNFDLSYFKDSDPKVKEWLTDMPKGHKSARVLYFTNEESLYEEDPNAETVADKKTAVMLMKMPYIQPPAPKLQKVFVDIEKGEQIEQLELMTRLFLIESKNETPEWKPGIEQRKILDYVCMNASVQKGEDEVIAWFTPSIPVSLGPENYHGLPGLVLAVEVNGSNVALAISVDVSDSYKDKIVKPKEGKKISRENFEKLLEEKTAEYYENKKNKSKKQKFHK